MISFRSISSANPLSILNNSSLETLGVLDVHGLDIAVQLLLGALLIVTLSRDAYS